MSVSIGTVSDGSLHVTMMMQLYQADFKWWISYWVIRPMKKFLQRSVIQSETYAWIRYIIHAIPSIIFCLLCAYTLPLYDLIMWTDVEK